MFQVSYSYVISVKLCGEEMKYCSISLLCFSARPRAAVEMELIGSRISCSALFFSFSSVAAPPRRHTPRRTPRRTGSYRKFPHCALFLETMS